MEKVKVPYKVGKALECLFSIHTTKLGVVNTIERCKDDATNVNSRLVYEHFNKDIDAVMAALVNGYEVEKSSKEKVKMYFDHVEKERLRYPPGPLYHENLGKSVAIKTTLELLGIKISGVND